MNPTLLSTKFFRPSPRTIDRSALWRQLSQGLRTGDGFSRRFTLVSAGAGFGKTTLVASWVSRLGARVAWLSLDEKDGTPLRFLAYLVGAVEACLPGFGQEIARALEAPMPPSTETILVRLINDLAEVPGATVLVLDDFHEIGQPFADEIVAFLIDRLPDHVHLVVSTREDPNLPLARYRARGVMAELRAADLRFSKTEAEEFLRGMAGVSLKPAEVTALEARTEGWPAGLQFAALALRGNPGHDPGRFIEEFSGTHRFVLDYLLEEVFFQQSAEVQAFLMETAWLDRFCGPLGDAVLDLEPGQGARFLESLDRANLFLVPLDDDRRWYRYHHLFGQLLRDRGASKGRGPEGVFRKAAEWLETNGFYLEAFRYRARAGDAPGAAALIGNPALPQHSNRLTQEFLEWLAALPEAVKDRSPELWLKQAQQSLVLGRTTGIREVLDRAEQGLRRQAGGDLVDPYVGLLALPRAVLAVSQYQIDELFHQATLALERLPNAFQPSRILARWCLGIGHHLAGHPEARAVFEQVLAEARAAKYGFAIELVLPGLGELLEADADLAGAFRWYQESLDLAGDFPLPYLCDAYLGQARILFQWDDLERAEEAARRALTLALEYDASIDRFVPAEIVLARVEGALGKTIEARCRLSQLKTTLKPGFAHRLLEIEAELALLDLREGRCPNLSDEVAKAFPDVAVKVLLRQENPDQAAAVVEAALSQARQQQHRESVLRYLVLAATVRDQRGDHPGARAALNEALERGEPGGYLRLFVDEGTALAPLLKGLRSTHAGYVDKILTRRASAGSKPRTVGRTEPLSTREAEVLGLLAQGKANQDIADQLFISPLTVKVHLRNLFTKLGVTNRTAAAAQARDLGLLP